MCFGLTREVVHESGKWNWPPTASLPVLSHTPSLSHKDPPPQAMTAIPAPHTGIPGHGVWRQEEDFEIAP